MKIPKPEDMPARCTNCSNEDRGEPNMWYRVVKFDDKKEPCSVCNGESVWGK